MNQYQTAYIMYMKTFQVVDTIRNLKHLRCLEKWHKFIEKVKSSSSLNIHWVLKPNWPPSAVWTGKLKKTEQIDGLYKDGLCENIFNTKKKDISVHYLEFAIFANLTNCHWFSQRCGVGWKSFEKLPKGRGRVGTVILKSYFRINSLL